MFHSLNSWRLERYPSAPECIDAWGRRKSRWTGLSQSPGTNINIWQSFLLDQNNQISFPFYYGQKEFKHCHSEIEQWYLLYINGPSQGDLR